MNGDGRSTFVDWTPEGSMHGGPHPRMFRRGQSDLALSLMLESHAGEGLDGCVLDVITYYLTVYSVIKVASPRWL